jgi:hypothetical protein
MPKAKVSSFSLLFKGKYNFMYPISVHWTRKAVAMVWNKSWRLISFYDDKIFGLRRSQSMSITTKNKLFQTNLFCYSLKLAIMRSFFFQKKLLLIHMYKITYPNTFFPRTKHTFFLIELKLLITTAYLDFSQYFRFLR